MLIFTFAELAKVLNNSLIIYINIDHICLISQTQTLLRCTQTK